MPYDELVTELLNSYGVEEIASEILLDNQHYILLQWMVLWLFESIPNENCFIVLEILLQGVEFCDGFLTIFTDFVRHIGKVGLIGNPQVHKIENFAALLEPSIDVKVGVFAANDGVALRRVAKTEATRVLIQYEVTVHRIYSDF